MPAFERVGFYVLLQRLIGQSNLQSIPPNSGSVYYGSLADVSTVSSAIWKSHFCDNVIPIDRFGRVTSSWRFTVEKYFSIGSKQCFNCFDVIYRFPKQRPKQHLITGFAGDTILCFTPGQVEEHFDLYILFVFALRLFISTAADKMVILFNTHVLKNGLLYVFDCQSSLIIGSDKYYINIWNRLVSRILLLFSLSILIIVKPSS